MWCFFFVFLNNVFGGSEVPVISTVSSSQWFMLAHFTVYVYCYRKPMVLFSLIFLYILNFEYLFFHWRSLQHLQGAHRRVRGQHATYDPPRQQQQSAAAGRSRVVVGVKGQQRSRQEELPQDAAGERCVPVWEVSWNLGIP